MSKVLSTLAKQPWVAFVDDERHLGNSIVITLADGWFFKNEPDCGVQGFDTIKEAQQGAAKSRVFQKA